MISQVRLRDGHPRVRKSLRWWIAGRALWALMAIFMAGLVATAMAVAIAYTLTIDSPMGNGKRLSQGHQLLDRTLEALRACVGTDSLDVQSGNSVQEFLSTLTSVIGALVPATLVGICFIKIFSFQPFVWRKRVSISLASQADAAAYAAAHSGSQNAIMAVRFYNRLENLTLVDLCARAYLWYLEESPHDHSPVLYKQRLRVLDSEGVPAQERSWFTMDRGTPFTIWIPVEAPVAEFPMMEIQGKSLVKAESARIVIRLSGKAAGLGTEVFDERWFHLGTDDFELGRFAPVEPKIHLHTREWRGWDRFENLLDQTVPHQPTQSDH